MVSIERSAGLVDAGLAAPDLVAELLGGHDQVAGDAQVARVGVDVEAAVRQRLDVVDDRCLDGQPCSGAALAEAVGAPQAPEALALAGAASKPLDNHQPAIVPPCCLTGSSTNVSDAGVIEKPISFSPAACLPSSPAAVATLSTASVVRM